MDKNDTSNRLVSRVFKSGNSQAVRIPAELAFASNDMEVTVTRRGDELVIAPRRPSVEEMFAKLRALPEDSKFGPIERTLTRETEWDR
ncbi:antitoxin VapB [Rhizomicrobium palustre]|uniref:Antitoxin VapB n=1 Tax=Rhizomicrobium palustre TaxID=189966 RepID=A0A846N377_9PROT|nr:AbrB/MazE/SpoVT family DNA-binding domain-containing protein [Rhizomicrobium palustre]NIK89567.1 antitoxin VapB [Rhizomicrobium palustre]